MTIIDNSGNNEFPMFLKFSFPSYCPLQTAIPPLRKKMNSASKKLFKLLIDTERVADHVLQNKQEILELDKRRQTNRIAIRDLGKNEDKKVWITIGPILVKMEKGRAIDLLKKGMIDRRTATFF